MTFFSISPRLVMPRMRWTGFVLAMATAMLITATAVAAPKLSQAPPPQAADFSILSARWWKWVLAIPAADNPLLDETGAKVAVGQTGDIWFLAGVINVSGSAERTASIPAGKWLFFPVLNFENDNELCLDPDTSFSLGQLRKNARDLVDAAIDLIVEVDGAPAPYKRAVSPPFSITLPEDNVLQMVGCADAVAGTYSPAISDGFWAMIPPLTPGTHTIHFGGTFSTSGFTLDIIYNLTVVP